MDTLKQYKKMCGKATILQAEWVPQIGDYCTHPVGRWGHTLGVVVTSSFDKIQVFRGTASKRDHFIYENVEEFKTKDCTWLPSQDRLQDMIWTIDPPHWTLVHGLSEAIQEKMFHSSGEVDITYIQSMEQLWLAFVMLENHNRIWNGDDWTS